MTDDLAPPDLFELISQLCLEADAALDTLAPTQAAQTLRCRRLSSCDKA